MSEFKVTGKITEVKPEESGQSKSGTNWVAMDFIIDTGDQYDNIFYFALFGSDKIENFKKYHKIGDSVTVKFNIKTRFYEGKPYTNLSAWRVEKDSINQSNDLALKGQQEPEWVGAENEQGDDLPF